MSYGSSSYGEHTYGSGAAAGPPPATPTLDGPDAAELFGESIAQELGPIDSAELTAEYVTDGIQLAGPDAAELNAASILVGLTAPSGAALNAQPIAQPLAAPDAAELTSDVMAPVLFDTFQPAILRSGYIYGPGSATWTTVSLSAVVGTKTGQITDIVGVS